MVQVARDSEYVKLPMEATLEFPAIVRTVGSDLKPSEDDVVGNMVLQHSLRAINGFQEGRHLGTDYNNIYILAAGSLVVFNGCDIWPAFDNCH